GPALSFTASTPAGNCTSSDARYAFPSSSVMTVGDRSGCVSRPFASMCAIFCCIDEAGPALLEFDAANATANIRMALGIDALRIGKKKAGFTVSIRLPQLG